MIGLFGIIKDCINLTELNIAGTNITEAIINYILKYSFQLKKLNLRGCKNINMNHVLILEEHGIKVDFIQDICKFNLFPQDQSLPLISNNILKVCFSIEIS